MDVPEQGGQQLELRITLTETGQVQVHGPVANAMLCYGLLEAAKDAIRTHNAAPRSGIVQARLNGLSRM